MHLGLLDRKKGEKAKEREEYNRKNALNWLYTLS